MIQPTFTRIGVIGAGAAGLITAHTLLRDGFQNVEVLTRDESPGGVWAAERVYPGLTINNVHGEFRFSPLPMPPPADAAATGGRLSGEDMRLYMETFASRFLPGKIKYRVEVLRIRPSDTDAWTVTVRHLGSNSVDDIVYDKIVLCTGGCSAPRIPDELTPEKAKSACFSGPILHSSQFGSRLADVVSAGKTGDVVIIGGGKSAQDIAAYLARRDIPVSMVFKTTDAVLATPVPYPAAIRKSRFLSVLSPHAELLTGLERFLHTTWLGSLIVRGMWALLTWSSFWVLSVPRGSPLRNAPNPLWTVRTNDEGTGRKDGFHALVKQEKIKLLAPARAVGYGADSRSILLDNGGKVPAAAVVLATGFTSSWSGVFDDTTMNDLGLGRIVGGVAPRGDHHWNYTTLARSSFSPNDGDKRGPSLYRGIVPAKNILRRNLAVNGAIYTTNNGYIHEVTANWISSYFLEDSFLHLPLSPEGAVAWTNRNAAWLRQRYPDALSYANESYSGDVAFWSWPQLADGLLADMQLQTMRSGGNAFTWPFKVIDLDEIKHLREERAALRAQGS
ncbi:FAD/NAD-P-binding domain-containing protein [Rhodofomes roseus]|uniref:FAD/NAD-P-binding domain-containing protein n=1 Tax=Rhodofomes roseus TaxID=34475 RepID=A0ABQ8KIH6_9APHY|nr:FAD/NAD-P-binding domain-containing protein [Rhodofomes roseus]KAH9837771.1 FAD/NAD-P-binding domain-containing protein [Rhodofomes roseus]